MIEGLIGWITDFGNRVSFFVVPVNAAKSGVDWIELLPTAVSGGITLLVALGTFQLTVRHERKLREDERHKIAAAEALSGYYKLSQWVDLVANYKMLIDSCFQDAHEAGLESAEPYEVVKPFAGRFAEPEPIRISEFSFLFTKRHLELINDITLLEKRSANVSYLVNEYSRMRTEMAAWVEKLPGVSQTLDGAVASIEIPREFASQKDVRAGQLNQVLVGIIEQLEKDVPALQQTLLDYVDAAHSVFGADFPKLELEFVQP